MNAILLAGDSAVSRPFGGMNKAFLPLEGWPLLVHVLAALNGASRVDAIYVIGPRKRIMEAVEKALPVFLFSKKIEVLEQQKGLIENIYHAYGRAIGQEEKDLSAPWGADCSPALFLPSDIPLVTPDEIDAFIASANMRQSDYCLGVVSEAYLQRFYPTPHEQGIKMSYLYLKDRAYRINNLHMARLRSIAAGPLFQAMYNHRHQKSIWNRLRMVFALLRTEHGKRPLVLYLLAQAAVLCMRFGWHRAARYFRRFLVIGEIERDFSRLFNMRFKVIETNLGGAALDIDDETTYHTLSALFLQWRDRLSPAGREQCPFETTCQEAVSSSIYPISS